MMRQTGIVIAAIALLLLPKNDVADPFLDIQDGELLGASGIDVEGTLYDVNFQVGTCVEIFNGCDDDSKFDFDSEFDAVPALQALLDQVFLDGALGQFDSIPTLTAGCTGAQGCAIATPFHLSVDKKEFYAVIAVNNAAISAGDSVGAYYAETTLDFADQSGLVFAVWSREPTSPEPPEFVLLGVCLFGIALSKRRRKAWAQQESRHNPHLEASQLAGRRPD
jgi:hypothetical protein